MKFCPTSTTTLALHLIFIDEEDDGLGGGYDVYRVSEAMAGIDVGIATGVLATFLGADPIVVGGTQEQKHHWMSRIANEGCWSPMALRNRRSAPTRAQLTTKAVPVLLNDDGSLRGTTSPAANGGSPTAVWRKFIPSQRRPAVRRGSSWRRTPKDSRRTSRRTSTASRQQHGRASSWKMSMSMPTGSWAASRGAGAGAGRLWLHVMMAAAFGLGAGWAVAPAARSSTARRASRAAPRSTRSRATWTS